MWPKGDGSQVLMFDSLRWPSQMFSDPSVPSSIWYGIQSALSPDDHSPLGYLNGSARLPYLFSDFCVSANNSYSCFNHCNGTQMFSPLPRLHNCIVGMFLSNLATPTSDNVMAVPGPHSNLTASSVNLVQDGMAQEMGMSLKNCLLAGAKILDRNMASVAQAYTLNDSHLGVLEQLDQSGSSFLSSEVCLHIRAQAQADFGGIGVRSD